MAKGPKVRSNLLYLAGSLVLTPILYARDMLPVGIATAILLVIVALRVPGAPEPPTITRLPSRYERSRSRWLPGFGLFLRVPFIHFLSIGIWRWRGRR